MAKCKLTKKQEIVLNYIKEYTATHGYPPAVREIAKGVGLNSPSSVHSHLKRLQNNGFLKNNNGKFRTLEVVGINEFKEKNNETICLKLYTETELINNEEATKSYDFPISRAEKNCEIIAINIENNNNYLKKDDIAIIAKTKIFKKNNIILFIDNNTLENVKLISEKEYENKQILGKLIEINHKY